MLSRISLLKVAPKYFIALTFSKIFYLDAVTEMWDEIYHEVFQKNE